jgi:hypothetical protein
MISTKILTTAESHEDEKRRKIIELEDKTNGQFKTKIIFDYFKSGGILYGLFAIFLLIASQLLLMMQAYSLSLWASKSFENQDHVRYVVVFAILTFLCIVLGFMRVYFWFVYALKCFYLFIAYYYYYNSYYYLFIYCTFLYNLFPFFCV